jgi:hypothetical protein
MHSDGHVYHRYGGRDERGPGVWLSEASLERVLGATLAEHEAYSAKPAPPEHRAPLRIDEVPAFRKRDKGECIHCHNVFPALYEEERAAGSWSEDDRWVYPPPGRIGIDLDRDEQRRVVAVAPGSPAAAAGLAAGDVLLRAGAQVLLTSSDLSQVLHDLGPGPATLVLQVERDGEPRELTLELAPGWKRGTPLEFSWRPFKWAFMPAPGFGGRALGADEKRALGLDPGAFAFRVTYLETWGDAQRFGEAATRAGLRKGDVFLASDGKRDFASVDHFHAWWRLTRTSGAHVELEILRDGERRTLDLEVLP